MKKTFSKLLALALVLAMVCAMVPAAFAGDPLDTGNSGSSDAGGAGAAAKITWTGVDSSYEVGAAIDLSAVKCSEVGHTVDFSTEDTDILTINGKTATAKAVGSATITATCKGSGCTATDTKAISITAKQVTLSTSAVATLAASKKNVAKGTAFANISLPTTVATSQAGVNATITWTASDYKANTLGEQTIRGTASLSSTTYALTGTTDVSTIINVQEGTPVSNYNLTLTPSTTQLGGAYNSASLSAKLTDKDGKTVTAPVTFTFTPSTGVTVSKSSVDSTTGSASVSVYTAANSTAATIASVTVKAYIAGGEPVATKSVSFTLANVIGQYDVQVSATDGVYTFSSYDFANVGYNYNYNYNYYGSSYYYTNTPAYIMFGTPSGGTMYCQNYYNNYNTGYNYSYNNYYNTYGAPHSTGNRYYLSGYNYSYNYTNGYTYNQMLLEDLTFVLNYNYNYNYNNTYNYNYNYSSSYYNQYNYNNNYYYYNTPAGTVSYTAYSYDNKQLYSGTVRIYNNGNSNTNGNINYYVNANNTVSLAESDFTGFFTKQSGSTYGALNYVKFTGANLNSTNGTLYDASGIAANAGYTYYASGYSNNASYKTLSGMYFKAGTRTTAYNVSIPFTAYGTRNGSTGIVSFSGTMVIHVNSTNASGNISITTAGKSFSDLGVVTTMRPTNYSSTLTNNLYVKITGVTGGTLYNTSNTSSSNIYSANTKYYFTSTSTNYVGNLFFKPNAGATTASISYSVYRTTGTTSSYYYNTPSIYNTTYNPYGTSYSYNYNYNYNYGYDQLLDSGTLRFTVTDSTSQFTDMSQAAWAKEAVSYMADKGYITGTSSTTFAPKALMTRGQLVAILYRMAGSPSVSGIANKFTDVKTGDYYYNAVLWAANKGYVSGTSATTFKPNAYITRQDLAKILHGYAGSPVGTGTIDSFPDKTQISSYATAALKWAVGKGVITGNAGKLAPKANATRAEVAQMLYNYLTK